MNVEQFEYFARAVIEDEKLTTDEKVKKITAAVANQVADAFFVGLDKGRKL